MPLDISINGAHAGMWTLMERDGVLHAPEDAFTEWRLQRRPGAPAVSFRGQTWYALAAVPGFEARLNLANQSVDLAFSPQAFAATRLSAEDEKRPPVTPAEPALFLNFDTTLSQTAYRGAATSRDIGMLTELGASSRFGVLTSSFVSRNLGSNDPAQPDSTRRLETAFVRDFPDSRLTLRVGDSATRSAPWGRATYFGGVQLASNFALAPGFVSQPIPTLTGSSSAPSTVELYVNDVLRQTSSVPTGPFAIDNFPALTGAGQARLVVRDLLGRETVIVHSFFSHDALLARGLSEWSLEAGAVRRNLGTNNAEYGQPFAAGLWRHGVSDDLTLRLRGEGGRDTRAAGVDASFALPLQMLGQAGLALSHDHAAGRGHTWLLGMEGSHSNSSFSLRTQGASRNWRPLGLSGSSLPNRSELSASYSHSLDTWGVLGVGFARIATFDRGTVTTLSANYSMRLGERGSLTFSASRASGVSSGVSLGASLTMPLGEQVNASASVSHRGGATDAYASASKALSAETGLGWRTLAGTRGGTAYTEGGLYYQGDKQLLTGDTSVSATQQTLRLGAQGGLVFMGGRFFRARYLQDSFALVEVPGHANVGVGFHGSVLTRTDEYGQALLPRLIPYQANSIRLDPSELPISAELDNIEQVAVPAWRSGVRVTFPVRSGRGALLRIVLDDGEPAPAGAPIELVGDKQEFFVARRGEAFVTGLQSHNTLRLSWKGAACSISVALPPGTPDEIARIGPLACTGVKR